MPVKTGRVRLPMVVGDTSPRLRDGGHAFAMPRAGQQGKTATRPEHSRSSLVAWEKFWPETSPRLSDDNCIIKYPGNCMA